MPKSAQHTLTGLIIPGITIVIRMYNETPVNSKIQLWPQDIKKVSYTGMKHVTGLLVRREPHSVVTRPDHD